MSNMNTALRTNISHSYGINLDISDDNTRKGFKNKYLKDALDIAKKYPAAQAKVKEIANELQTSMNGANLDETGLKNLTNDLKNAGIDANDAAELIKDFLILAKHQNGNDEFGRHTSWFRPKLTDSMSKFLKEIDHGNLNSVGEDSLSPEIHAIVHQTVGELYETNPKPSESKVKDQANYNRAVQYYEQAINSPKNQEDCTLLITQRARCIAQMRDNIGWGLPRTGLSRGMHDIYAGNKGKDSLVDLTSRIIPELIETVNLRLKHIDLISSKPLSERNYEKASIIMQEIKTIKMHNLYPVAESKNDPNTLKNRFQANFEVEEKILFHYLTLLDEYVPFNLSTDESKEFWVDVGGKLSEFLGGILDRKGTSLNQAGKQKDAWIEAIGTEKYNAVMKKFTEFQKKVPKIQADPESESNFSGSESKPNSTSVDNKFAQLKNATSKRDYFAKLYKHIFANIQRDISNFAGPDRAQPRALFNNFWDIFFSNDKVRVINRFMKLNLLVHPDKVAKILKDVNITDNGKIESYKQIAELVSKFLNANKDEIAPLENIFTNLES